MKQRWPSILSSIHVYGAAKRRLAARNPSRFVRTKQQDLSHNWKIRIAWEGRPATICRIVIMFPSAYHASDLYQRADWQKNKFYRSRFT